MTASDLTLHRELARKGIHLTAAAAPAAYAAGAGRDHLTWLLGAVAAIAVALEALRLRSVAVHRAIDRLAGPLFRAHEHARPSGATWLALSLFAAVLLLPRNVAIAAMWAAAAGDPAAAIVGRSVGRLRIGPHGKSVEGAVACLAITALGAWWLAGYSPLWAIGAGAVAAAAEWRGPFDDNVRITAIVGAFLLGLRMFAA